MAFPTPAARNNSQVASNSTSHTVALPDGIGTGDRVLIMFGSDGAPDAALTGWIRFFTSNAPGPNARLNWFYRDIDGTEGFDGLGDTVSVTTATAQHSSHRTWRWDAGTFDAATAPEPTLAGTAPSGVDTTPDPPSLSPSWGAEDTWWAAGFCSDADSTVSDFPDDFTDTFSQNTGSAGDGCAIGVAERELNAATLDPTTFTQSLGEQWVAGTVAIRPASGGATVHTGSVSIAGLGALAGAGLGIFHGAVSVAGLGGVAGAAGLGIFHGGVTIVGSGSMAGTGTGIFHGQVVIPGVGAVTADGELAPPGPQVHAGQVVIVGQGAVIPAGDIFHEVIIHNGQVTIVGEFDLLGIPFRHVEVATMRPDGVLVPAHRDLRHKR